MIWVVTNHHQTSAALPQLLARRAYRVADIDCGDEVLKRLRFQSPSLVIIDCGMPDGFETLISIRSEHRGRTIPVLMFSHDDQNLKVEALLRGADSYVPKGSLDWVELLAEVVRLAGPPSDA